MIIYNIIDFNDICAYRYVSSQVSATGCQKLKTQILQIVADVLSWDKMMDHE